MTMSGRQMRNTGGSEAGDQNKRVTATAGWVAHMDKSMTSGDGPGFMSLDGTV